MTLFTKAHCNKCDYIKGRFDLKSLGIKIEVLPAGIKLDTDISRYVSAIAHAAWHEIIGTAEELLPILVTDKSEVIAGAVNIKKYLDKIKDCK